MKLIYCPTCGDVLKPWVRAFGKVGAVSRCECGKSWGYYEKGGQHARFGGKAIPLGIDNSTLWHALKRRAINAQHPIGFVAFTIEDGCPTFQHQEVAPYLPRDTVKVEPEKQAPKEEETDDPLMGKDVEEGKMEWEPCPRADGRMEWLCECGIGHGNHVHGCCGCCSRGDYPGRSVEEVAVTDRGTIVSHSETKRGTKISYVRRPSRGESDGDDESDDVR